MKENFDIIKMNFKSPLHLSKGKEDSYDSSNKSLHSDTLQSAIFVCAIEIFGDDVANKDFFESYQVSSAFPFYEDEFFFPKPQKDFNLFKRNKEETKDIKKIKKIDYLSKFYFEQFLNGKEIIFEDNKAKATCYSDILEKESNDFKLFESETNQRVSIPRFLDADSNLFYMDRIYFKENAGLYFILQVSEEKNKSKIMAALHHLSERGIGTDRNVGQGNFEIEESKITIDVPEKTTTYLNLSLFAPKDEDSLPNLKESYYSLLKRGGWISNPKNQNHASWRKKSIYMFGEGSVFESKDKPKGKIFDLKPKILENNENPHSIWRDGRGIFLPMKLI